MIARVGFMGVLDFYVEKWYNGNSKTENADDTYFRAKRFLTYLRRVRKWTKMTVFSFQHTDGLGELLNTLLRVGLRKITIQPEC